MLLGGEEEFPAAVGGAAVDDDDLCRGKGLGGEASEEIGEVADLIQDGGSDRDGRHAVCSKGAMLSVEDTLVLVPGPLRSMGGLFDRFRRRPVDVATRVVPAHPFDGENGTDTGGLILPEQLRTRDPQSLESSAYYAMSPSRFWAAVELWMTTPPAYSLAEYSFLDLGCGKGRALLLATELQFREAIGVELHGGLARTARRNLRLWAGTGRARCPARVVAGDATEVDLPAGPCLVYLFHPFGAVGMARLIARLRGVMRDRPGGSLDVIYFNPEAGELWRKQPEVRLLWSRVLPMSAADTAADPVANPDDFCEGYRWERASEPGLNLEPEKVQAVRPGTT